MTFVTFLTAGCYYDVSLAYSAVMECHIVFFREIMALRSMRKKQKILN